MTGINFDIEGNNTDFIKKVDEIREVMAQLSIEAELQSGKIDAAFNRISLEALERFKEIMSDLPHGTKELELLKKQIANIERQLETEEKSFIDFQNKGNQVANLKVDSGEAGKEVSAYKSLINSINDLLDARGQNIALMLQEQNAIRLNQKELKTIESIESDGLKLSDAQQMRRIQLTNSIMQHEHAVSSLQQVINSEIAIQEASRGAMDEMSQTLGRMRSAYRQLNEAERNTQFGGELVRTIQEADLKIKQLDSTIGVHIRNVANYSSQWNELNMSMRKTECELSSLGSSAGTFFSTIINNAPVLADELQKAKQKNDALNKSGEDTIPVWRQVTSSLFSWKSALSLGITFLTLYGDKLVDWVGKLFNSQSAIKNIANTQKLLNDIQLEGTKNAQDEIVKLDLLYNATQDTSKSIKERSQAINELKNAYPTYFKDMSDEAILAGKAASKYQELSSAIIASARARAAQDRMTENAKRILENESKITEEYTKRESRQAILDSQRELFENLSGTAEAQEFQIGVVVSAREGVDEIDETITKLRREIYEINKSQIELAKNISVDDLVFTTTDDNSNFDNQSNSLREQEESYNQLLNKQAHDRIRSEQDLQNQIEQARINAMKEGSVRTLAQMKLDHDKEKQQLVRQKEDALASTIEDERTKFEANPENKDNVFNASDIKLSKPQADGFAKQESYLRQEQANDIENYYKSLHDGYQNYTEQRLAIEEKYNNDIAALQEARKKYEKEGDTEKVQQTDRSIAQATKGKGTALMGLDYEQLKQSPEYVRAFENLKYTSSETLNSLLNQLENAKGTAAEVLSPDQLREYTTTIQEIMNELDERNPFQSLIDKKEELALAEEMVAQAQVELENARQQSEDVKSGNQVENGFSTKYNKETGKIDSTKVYLSESQALANVKDRLDKYNQAKDNVVEKTEKVKEAEQKAKDVIDDLSQSISSLGASIEGPAGEIISLIGEIGSFTMMAMGGIDVASKTASTAIQTVEKASVILAIIGAAIQIGMKIAELFNKDDKKEKKIEQLQDQIDVLDKAYEKLGDSIEKAYSTDASKLISQQNEMLEQQKILIQNQILEEKNKKKSDGGRIKEWEDQIESINKQIGQNEEKKIDIVLGSDAKSAIDEFAQAYADAWAAGNDRAKSSKDLVKDMIKQMVMEAIKMTSSEPMQKLREKLAGFFSDGIISAWEREQIEKDAEAITKDLDSKYGWADEYMKGDEESNSQEGSTKGGFETMSQETGSELNGRFTALQISNEEIRNSMLLVLGNLSSLCTTTSDGNILLTEMRNLAVMSNGHLEDIAKHTKVLLGFGDKLDKIEKNTHGL